MARRLRLLILTVAIAAAAATLAIVGLASDRSAAARPAPALPREQLAGPPAPPLASGRSKLVVFWASWCDPCAQEAPAIEHVSRSAAGRGRVIGVNWNDALSGARSFLRRHAWTFPNVRDGEGTVGSAYRITGLPTTFVVDARGRIRDTLRGPQGEASLVRALNAAS